MDTIKKLREKVIEANRLYGDLRTTIKIPEGSPYQWEGIKALSEPFVKGVFTLAIIGNMSAGKSAFINALLEDEDLLPTGHFQTTCTLTEIVWAPEKKMIATFADGHQSIVSGDEVNSQLKELVAINPIFESLPINHINELILLGENYEEILQKSDTLKKASGRVVDPSLLKQYVEGDPEQGIPAKTKGNIPVNVYIEYPLLDSFKGWRIVDTPGIGALGGIDQTTKDFLVNESVDAAIFVFNGSEHIETTEVLKMVKTSYNELSDVAKERTFFVITHAGEQTCRTNLDKTLKTALNLFSEGDVAIPEERFFAVDSLLSLLYDIAIVKHNLDATIFNTIGTNIEEMSKNEIKVYKQMIVMISEELVDEGKEVNTENLNSRIQKIAGFSTLKRALGDFAGEAKKEAYERLIATIQEDLISFASKKKEDIELWSAKLVKSPAEFERDIKEKKNEITTYKNDLFKRFNDIMLQFSSTNLSEMFPKSYQKLEQKVESASDVAAITNAYENFVDMFSVEEQIVLQKFTNECKEMQVNVSADHSSVVLPPIDIEGAKAVAKQRATHTKSRTYKVADKGIINGIKRFWDALSGTSLATYQTKIEYFDVVVPEEQLAAFKDEVLGQVKETMAKYSEDLFFEIIEPTGINIQNQIGKLVDDKKCELDAIQEAASNADEIVSIIDGLKVDLVEIDKTANKTLSLSQIHLI